jgi:hypothetical protein
LVEKRKGASGRWKVNHTERYLILPDYFKFYNSYNASLQEVELNQGFPVLPPPYPSFDEFPYEEGSESAPEDDRAPLYEYQKRSKLGIIAWFLHRNWWNLLNRLVIAGVVIWLCFFGGLAFLIDNFVEFLVKSTDQKKDSSVSAPAVPGEIVSETGTAETVAETGTAETVAETGTAETVAVAEAESDEKKNDPYKIVLLDFNRVVFHNGLMIDRGEPFPESSRYRGSYVTKFDLRKRCIVLSDGSILWMRPQVVEN